MNIDNIKKLIEFDTPTVANGLEQLGVLDPTVGYTGPDVRALMPQMGVRVGIAVTSRMNTTSAGVDNPPSLFRDWVYLMVKTAKVASTGGHPAAHEVDPASPKAVSSTRSNMATAALLTATTTSLGESFAVSGGSIATSAIRM